MAKKLSVKKFIQTSVFLFGSSLLLAGCSNFLKGADTAEKLRTAVNYANAKPYLIKVQPEKGTGSVVKPASGEALKKITDVFEIKFEPSQEYEFVTWQVSSKKLTSGQSINDYITIEDPSKPETTVTFKNELEDIVITPLVARRPKLLSKSPEKSGGLALKDTKIQVIFDRKMDSSSIYYSEKEIKELKNELDLQDQDFLPENAVIGTTNIYGYKKTNSKGEVEYFYKNILIKNNDTQENITDRFEAPYFETPTTLVIVPNKAKYPDGYTYISISLDKNFCYNFEYEKNSKKIGLLESADWVYQVNNSTDNVPPRMTKSYIYYYNDNDDPLDTFDSSTKAGYEYKTWCLGNNPIPTLLQNDDKKLDIEIEAGDEGSGLTSYFDIELCRFIDGQYFPCEESKTTLKTDFSSMGTTVSTYKGQLDLTGYQDGIYSISFVLHDNNGIESYWPKKDEKNACSYVIIDDGVNMDTLNFDYYPEENYNKKLILNWGEPAKDLAKIDIKYKKHGATTWTSMDSITNIFGDPENPVTKTDIPCTNFATMYDFNITYTDKTGNIYQIQNISDWTRPAPAEWGEARNLESNHKHYWECKVSSLPPKCEKAEILVYRSTTTWFPQPNFTDVIPTSYTIETYDGYKAVRILRTQLQERDSQDRLYTYYFKLRTYYEGKFTDNDTVYSYSGNSSNSWNTVTP